MKQKQNVMQFIYQLQQTNFLFRDVVLKLSESLQQFSFFNDYIQQDKINLALILIENNFVGR